MQNKRKSILIISALDVWTIGPHAGSQARWHTLKSYAEHSWNIHFITSYRERGFDKKIKDKYRNIHIHRLNLDRLQGAASKIPKIGFFLRILFWIVFQVSAFFAALKISRKEKIDVIYGYEIYGVPVSKLLSVLWKIPIVARYQGTILGLVWMKKFLWRVRAWQFLVAYKIPVDLIIMTNDGSQGDLVLKRLGVDLKKMRFWVNGVDWGLFSKKISEKEFREELSIDCKNILIVVSRLMRLKRVDRSIRALSYAAKKIPDVKLLIVGDGPEKERLWKLANDLGVKKYIQFIGAVSHEKIPKYLATADIFLSFYDWSNMGNPLIEAMMAGKCIVTLNNGDTGTIIKNNYNGILLEESDEEKLIKNISQNVINLLETSQLREKLGKGAKEFAKKNFWTWRERMKTEIKEVEKLIIK